jgi:hypothetical protein
MIPLHNSNYYEVVEIIIVLNYFSDFPDIVQFHEVGNSVVTDPEQVHASEGMQENEDEEGK